MRPIALILALALSGCATVDDHSWSRCELLRIAFDEQDELAPGWFVATQIELEKCGMKYSKDAAKNRGKS
jgi:hypothetical protein